MGAGSGNGGFAGSVSITNHTGDAIEIRTVQDKSLPVTDSRDKRYTIPPKESFVFFTDRVESLSWEKTKQG